MYSPRYIVYALLLSVAAVGAASYYRAGYTKTESRDVAGAAPAKAADPVTGGVRSTEAGLPSSASPPGPEVNTERKPAGQTPAELPQPRAEEPDPVTPEVTLAEPSDAPSGATEEEKARPTEPVAALPEPPKKEVEQPSRAPQPPEHQEDSVDQITFSPFFDYRSVRTNRAGNGQLVQLSTKLSPGLSLSLRQDWEDGLSLFAEGRVSRYDFESISGVTDRNVSGTAYSAGFGAEIGAANRVSFALFSGLDQNFAVDVGSDSVVEPVKYVRPEAGARLKVKMVRTERGSIFLAPQAAYAFSGSRNSDSMQGHLEYGAKLGFEKLARKLFYSTGAAIAFKATRFNSSQGTSKEACLGAELNFSFGF